MIIVLCSGVDREEIDKEKKDGVEKKWLLVS